MGELHRYTVTINGYSTVLKLTAEDAEKLYPEARRVDAAPDRKARTVPNKVRTVVENK